MNDQKSFGQTEKAMSSGGLHQAGRAEGSTPEEAAMATRDAEPGRGSQEKPDGLIQKAEEIAEQAVEGALEKTSQVVEDVIDKVADAAQRVLGGKPGQ